MIVLNSTKIFSQKTPKQFKTISIDTVYSEADSSVIIEKTEIEVETFETQHEKIESEKQCNSKDKQR